MSTTTETRTPILSARGIHKRYGNVTAIDGADFDLYPGEILAVIGDNGAGKSSLIKVLSGATIPDSATALTLDGEEVNFKSPLGGAPGGHRDPLPGPRAGPGAGHRDQPVFGASCGATARWAACSGRSTTRDEGGCRQPDGRCSSASARCQAVEKLSGGQRHAWRSRAPPSAPKLVIMDEPTAALGVRESGQVVELIRRVRDEGMR